MITFLRGDLVEKTPVAAIVDVGGVGYEVFIPLSTYEVLPRDGQPVKIYTRMIVREDAQQLYGFAAADEREIFDLLISISGVGPRLAVAVLSGMSVNAFKRAVGERNEAALTVIPGIGKKTAGRLVLELSEKMRRMGIEAVALISGGQDTTEDEQAIEALIALGLNRAEAATRLAKSKLKLGASAEAEELIKAALRG